MNMPYVEHALLLPLEHARPERQRDYAPTAIDMENHPDIALGFYSGTASLPIRIAVCSLFVFTPLGKRDPIKPEILNELRKIYSMN
jgi:hypothetical protein